MSTVVRPVGGSSTAARSEGAPRQLATRFDYALTYSLSMLTSLCGLAAFRLAHRNLGEAGFAEYALTRRALGFLVPLLSLGLAVAVARSVALRVAGDYTTGAIDLLRGAVLVTLASVGAFCLATWAWPDDVAYLCIGLAGRGALAWALTPLAGGLVLTACAASYCRGRMWVGASNALQLVCVGVIPNLVLLAVRDVDVFLVWTGLAVCGVSGAVLVALTRRGSLQRGDGALAAARTLLRDGATRTPGDLAFYGLLAAPAIVVARFAGLERGGDVAYALSLVTLFQQLVAPLSTLLLPEAAYLIHTRQTPRLRRRVGLMLAWSLSVTTLLAAVLALAAEPLVRFHLGACSPSLLAAVRWTVVAAVPLNLFTCVRSVIDAGERRAVTPALCVAALAAFAAIALAGGEPTVTRTLAAYLAAICLLAMTASLAALRVLTRSA